MICVLDASAAVEITLGKPGAIDLINRLMPADKVIAPTIFLAETANTFRKYAQGGFLSKEKAFDLYKTAIHLVDKFTDIAEISDEAFHEAIRLNHPVYDMLYLVLARRNGAKLLTCDKKLRLLFDSLL